MFCVILKATHHHSSCLTIYFFLRTQPPRRRPFTPCPPCLQPKLSLPQPCTANLHLDWLPHLCPMPVPSGRVGFRQALAKSKFLYSLYFMECIIRLYIQSSEVSYCESHYRTARLVIPLSLINLLGFFFT